MTTLKDRLLDGKVIGETFNIYNPEMLGESPVENYSYTVRDLQKGRGSGFGQTLLVADGEDGKKNCFPLAYRLRDEFIPKTPSQLEQTDQNTESTPDSQPPLDMLH